MELSAGLLEGCKKNDRKAQYGLYKMCFPILSGICRRYMRDDSDSMFLLNDGFLKILLNLDKYNVETPFAVWSRRIMINTILDEFRKRKSYKKMLRERSMQMSIVEEQTESVIDDKYNAEELLAMIRTLAPATQQIFNLFAIDGYSHFEIAQLLGIAEGTSKWHVSQARKLLSEELKKKDRNVYRILNG